MLSTIMTANLGIQIPLLYFVLICSAAFVVSAPSDPRRVSTDGSCQSGGAVCPRGYCCSRQEWCGTTPAHCGAGCQVGWGRCSSPSTTVPSSTPVTSVVTSPGPSSNEPLPTANPALPSVVTSVGPLRVIENCVIPNAVAITFDDGPYKYTSEIAQQFTRVGGRVTFFVNGLNYGCIYEQAEAVKAAFDAGHQIGSHTWSHPHLTALSGP